MGRKRRFRVDEIVEALEHCMGMVYLAAKELGCSPQTVYSYAKRHKKVREKIAEKKGERVDVAEVNLVKKVNEGQAWAICFTLKTLGKDRGYVERVERDDVSMSAESLVEDLKAMDATIGAPEEMHPVPPEHANQAAAEESDGHDG